MFMTLLQSALNRYLSLDPESSTRLKKLRNKIVTIELSGTEMIFQLAFLNEKIELHPHQASTADVYIKGTPFSLLRMAVTEGDRKHFFSQDVSIEGNLDLGQDVIDLFDQLEIDWEEQASHWIGDVSAHQLGRVISNIKNFSQRTRENIIQSINEYAHEEIEIFPPVEALKDFFTDIDKIRMDVDRAEARVKRLLLQLEK